MEKQATADSGSSSYLPIILGVVGGILLVVIILILIFWYKRQSQAKRTLKWKELGLDSPPAKGTTQRRFKLQRQKTIEFELPIAPKFITTLPQVNYDRYDSIGKIHRFLRNILIAIHLKNTKCLLNNAKVCFSHVSQNVKFFLYKMMVHGLSISLLSSNRQYTTRTLFNTDHIT